MTAPFVDPSATGPTFTTRRLLPFAGVLVIAALLPALPHDTTPIAKWWIAAWVMVAVTAAACLIAMRLPNGHWWHTVAPLLVFPTIQLLRASDGFAASGFTPLAFLPILWFALYGTARDLYLAIVAAINLFLWPIVVIGSPQYPASTLRGLVLFLIVASAAGLTIMRLVQSVRDSTSELVRSERRFRAAFEDAPVGMAITGVRGEGAGYFLRVNDALCVMFGRTADELTSRPVEAFTHPDDRTATRAWFDTATDPDVPHRIEKRFVHRSGRTLWSEVWFSVVRDEHGEPLHLVSQISDVGARRRADTALLQVLDDERAAADRLRELDRTRRAVLSNAAHDLRTPLTSATGFTELLLDGSAGDLTDPQRKLVETVDRGLARLGSIVDELVATARQQVEVTPRAHEPFDIGEVLDSATQAMSIMSSLAGQTLDGDNQLRGVEVRGEADRVDRVFANLIGNAVKFTPAGGTVRVDGAVRDGRP